MPAISYDAAAFAVVFCVCKKLQYVWNAAAWMFQGQQIIVPIFGQPELDNARAAMKAAQSKPSNRRKREAGKYTTDDLKLACENVDLDLKRLRDVCWPGQQIRRHPFWSRFENMMLLAVVVSSTYFICSILCCVQAKLIGSLSIWLTIFGVVLTHYILFESAMQRVSSTETKLCICAFVVGFVIACVVIMLAPVCLDLKLAEAYAELAFRLGNILASYELEATVTVPEWFGAIVLAMYAGCFSGATILPCFRFAKTHYQMLGSNISVWTKAQLDSDYWLPLLFLLSFFRPMLNLILSSMLRPCHSDAATQDCLEQSFYETAPSALTSIGVMINENMTESHVSAWRLGLIFLIIVNRFHLLSSHLQLHLRAANTALITMVDNEAQLSAAKIHAAMFQPYRLAVDFAMQYCAPLMIIFYAVMMLHQFGQQPLFVCEICRRVVGAEPGFIASHEIQPSAASAWVALRGSAKFFHPVMSFCLYWYCLSWFICFTISLMYWAGIKSADEQQWKEDEAAAAKKSKKK